MIPAKLPSAASSQIGVTNTATSLEDLIRVRSGDSAFTISPHYDSIFLQAEDGDVRFLYDGNTPTGALGIFVESGVMQTFIQFPIHQIQLIQVAAQQIHAGATTGTTANKLVDSGADFTASPTVTVGQLVTNTTDDTIAAVSAIDDAQTLSLDADIFVSGETYSVSTKVNFQYGSVN